MFFYSIPSTFFWQRSKLFEKRDENDNKQYIKIATNDWKSSTVLILLTTDRKRSILQTLLNDFNPNLSRFWLTCREKEKRARGERETDKYSLTFTENKTIKHNRRRTHSYKQTHIHMLRVIVLETGSISNKQQTCVFFVKWMPKSRKRWKLFFFDYTKKTVEMLPLFRFLNKVSN